MFLPFSCVAVCLVCVVKVTGAYICAIEARDTPSVMALSRQNCANLEGTSPESVAFGAYTLCEHGPGSTPKLIMVGTGTFLVLSTGA